MIEAIYIAAKSGEPQLLQKKIELCAGKGIVGDRNFGKSKWPGQNITLIERELIENYNAELEQAISMSDTRRNLITMGVRLNDLVGKKFSIGNVNFVGVELCEPCKNLGFLLSNEKISAQEVIAALLHKGGLRAQIINDGFISVGMSIVSESK